jgi:DNA-binding GntR family transcriptional regulator
VQVADEIQRRIAEGELQRGQRVPSETQIVDEFGVSRITARGAIAKLREQGLIHTVQGKGSFVGPEGTEHAQPDTKPKRIAAELAEEIRAGRYEKDVPLPSEATLMQRFDVAKATIRAAIALLREQGWVFTVPMRGTYVADRDKWPADG